MGLGDLCAQFEAEEAAGLNATNNYNFTMLGGPT